MTLDSCDAGALAWIVSSRIRAAIGVLVATAAAYGLARLFAGHDVKVFLPLWFVAVLLVLALRYGIAVGVIGSLLSAAIFALQPAGESPDQRACRASESRLDGVGRSRSVLSLCAIRFGAQEVVAHNRSRNLTSWCFSHLPDSGRSDLPE